MTLVMEDILELTEETACPHLSIIDLVPKSECTICRKGITGIRPYEHAEPEEVLIAQTQTPCNALVKWNCQCDPSIDVVPRDSEFVHISGAVSMKQIRALIARCPRLKLVEVVPSYAQLIRRHEKYLSTLGIGFVSCRRR